MRTILILWAIPIVLFWGWYGLSAYDVHFGLFFLTREFHDLIFKLYSDTLGLPAEDIPGWLAWVFFVDTLILFGVAALRWYKSWLPQTIAWVKERIGIVEEERDYVKKIYEPLVLARDRDVTRYSTDPMRSAE